MLAIREARPDDAEQLIAYVQRLAEEPDIDIPLAPGEFNLTVDEERKILEDCAASGNSVFLVAEADGQIVGAVNCKGGTRHTATLGISVRKEWRHQEVGRALIVGAIEWARRTGIVTRIELAVYARNHIHLYQQLGKGTEGTTRGTKVPDPRRGEQPSVPSVSPVPRVPYVPGLRSALAPSAWAVLRARVAACISKSAGFGACRPHNFKEV